MIDGQWKCSYNKTKKKQVKMAVSLIKSSWLFMQLIKLHNLSIEHADHSYKSNNKGEKKIDTTKNKRCV